MLSFSPSIATERKVQGILRKSIANLKDADESGRHAQVYGMLLDCYGNA